METNDTNMLSVSAAARRPRANTIADTQPSRTMEKTGGVSRDCSSGSFVTKLYKMVDSEPSSIVSWVRGGTAFCIVDPKMMAEHCLPKYFRHRRFSSLIRQLNFYSFYRVQEGQLAIYQHSFFRKDRPDLLVHIKRRGAGKAKDPWFDPLAPTTPAPKPPLPMTMPGLMVPSSVEARQQHIDTSSVNSSNMMCYSPLSKPLASSIDNMSPALKPATAHMIPPVADLGGFSITDSDKLMGTQKWDNQFLCLDDQKCDFSLLKTEPAFSLDLTPLSTASMNRGQSVGSSAIDIDIQDFLTDECSINTVATDKGLLDDRSSPLMVNGVTSAKRALIARDCLKWDNKTDLNCPRVEEHNMKDDDAAFEQELLLDLANVEPGAWEVPLSPLNEEEDVLPWLDLCF